MREMRNKHAFDDYQNVVVFCLGLGGTRIKFFIYIVECRSIISCSSLGSEMYQIFESRDWYEWCWSEGKIKLSVVCIWKMVFCWRARTVWTFEWKTRQRCYIPALRSMCVSELCIVRWNEAKIDTKNGDWWSWFYESGMKLRSSDIMHEPNKIVSVWMILSKPKIELI